MKKLWSLVILLFIILYISNSINVVAFSENMYDNKGVTILSNIVNYQREAYSLSNVRYFSLSVLLSEDEPLGGLNLFAPFMTIIVLILGVILLIYVVKSD